MTFLKIITSYSILYITSIWNFVKFDLFTLDIIDKAELYNVQNNTLSAKMIA